MGRENKKEAVAALHREQILKAAETLFSVKGYAQTKIEDISKVSGYSRRTIYAYYKSKDDMLHQIVEKGLTVLKQDIENALSLHEDFIDAYKAICMAMGKYQYEYCLSADTVNNVASAHFDFENLSDTISHILLLGTEINDLLAAFIEKGKEKKIVRRDVIPMLTVYVLWSGITALLTLSQTKGEFISAQCSITENEFLEYGFTQLINSILEVRI